MGIDAKIIIRKVSRDYCTQDKIKELNDALIKEFGISPFWRGLYNEYRALDMTLTRYREKDDPIPGSVYRQDGKSIFADDCECLLQIYTWSRFYGPGYERGDLLHLIALAEWVEKTIPGAEVWYGGDSSGICAKPWPRGIRDEFLRYYNGPHGRDYYKDFK